MYGPLLAFSDWLLLASHERVYLLSGLVFGMRHAHGLLASLRL